MNYQQNVSDLAMNLINKRMTYPLHAKDVKIEDVVYLDEGVYNTRATLVARQNSAFTGQVDVEYDRLNISHVFLGTQIEVLDSNQRLVSDYLPYLKTHYGLYLEEKDIVDGVINSDGINAPYTFYLKINPHNPAWYGEVEIKVVSTKRTLVSVLKEAEKVKYETALKGEANPHLYGIDFTPIEAYLSSYHVGQTIQDNLVGFINEVASARWYNESEFPTEFNLAYAKVIYNGLVKETTLSSREDLTHVMIIELDSQYCTNMKGCLLLHYNKSNKINW